MVCLSWAGITYEFTIPENYLANDDDKTNQQWFIVKDETMNGDNALTNGTIKVNPKLIMKLRYRTYSDCESRCLHTIIQSEELAASSYQVVHLWNMEKTCIRSY